jgi:hypothetical protein
LGEITSSLSQSVNYIKQLASYSRATAVTSQIFNRDNISGIREDLAETDLIPGYSVNPSNNENYLRACVDVLIQNSTDKNCYVKVTHTPGGEAQLSETDYTIKLPPGVMYNSDSKIANMRHSIYVPNNASRGEVSAMMTYNTTLLTDPAYPPLSGPNTVYSLAVNYYDFQPDSLNVPNEFYFSGEELYNRIVIYGQGRINTEGQEFQVYVTKDNNGIPTGSSIIDTTTPTAFSIVIQNPQNGNYEFVVDSRQGGLNNRGDGRVLFADVLFQNDPNILPPP